VKWQKNFYNSKKNLACLNAKRKHRPVAHRAPLSNRVELSSLSQFRAHRIAVSRLEALAIASTRVRFSGLWPLMVSVVVSIQMRKMFVEVRKMFLNVRLLSRMFVKGRRVGTSEPNSCSCEPA
jgi:hypothetical protein